MSLLYFILDAMHAPRSFSRPVSGCRLDDVAIRMHLPNDLLEKLSYTVPVKEGAPLMIGVRAPGSVKLLPTSPAIHGAIISLIPKTATCGSQAARRLSHSEGCDGLCARARGLLGA